MEALGRDLQVLGARLVDAPEEADLCIFNTCTVTATAAGKSRRRVRQLVRRAPHAQVLVTGCHATQSPEELRAISPRVLVVANPEKEDILAHVRAHMRAREAACPTPPRGLRTRAFVKVQDGCDNRCTYCVVRIARGPQRSRPPEEVLQEVRERVAEGYQEVVLTGVHVGAYGRDLGTDLPALVRRILAETEVRRLRLSSIEPHDLRPEFFALWEDPRLCPHLHLPLQSGSDAVLRRMGRRYTAGQFAAWVEAAREAIPDLAVTTDVIVGFPGETEEEFAETLAFVEAAGFARVHVFPFSPRPGTPAATMPGHLPPEVVRERHRALSQVAREGARRFARQFLGRTLEVLLEQRRARGDGQRPAWTGLTGNYLRVEVASEADLHNRILPVRLEDLVGDDRIRGRLERAEIA
ncbi:MAG: tRNA (N(6)-L-threonylcarbamoyladenosine(37)-C(2))-methylthiotransferase MtaB [Anaerolineae bacterium]|nr:tRNA (N(6)-L-threonylcarbamoyladenosine(37)-C(2))-methylthiotransferase MtaB [Anaerolineae bacterium]